MPSRALRRIVGELESSSMTPSLQIARAPLPRASRSDSETGSTAGRDVAAAADSGTAAACGSVAPTRRSAVSTRSCRVGCWACCPCRDLQPCVSRRGRIAPRDSLQPNSESCIDRTPPPPSASATTPTPITTGAQLRRRLVTSPGVAGSPPPWRSGLSRTAGPPASWPRYRPDASPSPRHPLDRRVALGANSVAVA